ncbi:hypothetical protein [Nocardiopsis sp. MG754419]|uniref:hypothetical protein n=1 Tax=Nocardiopsis sp. MG754419 TaxID=2259865 RepID=UPI001BA66B89|nr:hypothetical protein [Nocardiopsis sp. MG754419]
MPTPTGKSTRSERLAQPLAREVAEQVAADITAMAGGYAVGSSGSVDEEVS